MIIYGIDLSSRKVAIITLEGDGVKSAAIGVEKQESRGAELSELSKKIEGFLHTVKPGYTFIESPVVGRGGARPTILQSQVDGLLQAYAVRSRHHGVYSVNNKTWKKAVVGNGNASKDATASWLASNHPVLSDLCRDDQDLVDASCVALYGRDIVSRAADRYR